MYPLPREKRMSVLKTFVWCNKIKYIDLKMHGVDIFKEQPVA
jgi:hypothetical protein